MSSEPHEELQGSFNEYHENEHEHEHEHNNTSTNNNNNSSHEQNNPSYEEHELSQSFHLHPHSTEPIIINNDEEERESKRQQQEQEQEEEQEQEQEEEQEQEQSIMISREINSFEAEVLDNVNNKKERRKRFFKQEYVIGKLESEQEQEEELEPERELLEIEQYNEEVRAINEHHDIEHSESYIHTYTNEEPNQKIQHTLESLTWQLQKIYYRNFFNRLITSYIQSLKEEQKKIRETKEIEIKLLKEANWPFKELYYKKYRTPNEEIMFEFVNLCAEKIQATFKAYIVNKRHKLALEKVNTFKERLSAVLKGWKSSNIYNCKKLKEIRNNFMQISLQIDQEIENPNIDRVKKMKKIEYLQLSQETLRENFMKSYGYLYESGAWIFEVERCFKRVGSVGNNKRGGVGNVVKANTLEESNFTTTATIGQYEEQKPARRREREFKPLNNNNKNKDNNEPKEHEQQHETPPTTNNTSLAINNHPIQPIIGSSEERPIVAKGKYEFTEEDIRNGNENEFLTTVDDNNNSVKDNKNNVNKNKTSVKRNKNKRLEEQQQELNEISRDNNKIKRKDETNDMYRDMNNNEPQEHQQDEKIKVNKYKDEETKRLNKRQKYDPRKAIEEEKRLKLEKEKERLEKEKEKEKQINEYDDNNNVVTEELEESSEIATPAIKRNIIKKPIINNKNNLNSNRNNNRNEPEPKQERTPRIIQQREREQQEHSVSKEKTVEKIKKENRLNKKGDNNKSIKSIINHNHKRVESKVDCWDGQGKYNNRNSDNNNDYYNDRDIDSDNNNNNNNNMSSYKSKYLAGLIKERMEMSSSTSILKKANHVNRQYQEQYEQEQEQEYEQQEQEQQHEEQAYQSSYLKKLVEEQRLPATNYKGKFSYINSDNNINNNGSKLSEIITSIRGTTTKGTTSINSGGSNDNNNNSYKNNNNYQLYEKQRKSITGNTNNPTTNQNKTIATNNIQPVNNNTINNHRSIESLEEVYSSQYTDRLNNLKNKLNMLESARYIQRDESLPVLLEDTKYVKKMYKEGAFSTLYWPQVRTMETAFLDYVKLTTGF